MRSVQENILVANRLESETSLERSISNEQPIEQNDSDATAPASATSFRARAIIAAATVATISYFFPATIFYFLTAAAAYGAYRGFKLLNERFFPEDVDNQTSTFSETNPDDENVDETRLSSTSQIQCALDAVNTTGDKNQVNNNVVVLLNNTNSPTTDEPIIKEDNENTHPRSNSLS